MNDRKRQSYTSAESLPAKLLRELPLIQQAGVFPYHLQWIPTNRCNLSCKFCSCSSRTKTLEMGKRWPEAIDKFIALETEAVTITGGGEPLLHPHIHRMVQRFANAGIKVGLVTNGLALGKVSQEIWKDVTWCRISHSDDRDTSLVYLRSLGKVIEGNKGVDWAVSYVVTKEPNIDSLLRMVYFTNAQQLTHIRVVGDLLNPFDVPWDDIEDDLDYSGHSLQRVIMQRRQDPVAESKCLIGYIKPLISPDYRIYHCCGVQYAVDPMPMDLPDELCMGSVWEADKIWSENYPKPFDVPCSRCYYSAYNNVLKAALSEKGFEHGEFL